jgi:hypothetical protein
MAEASGPPGLCRQTRGEDFSHFATKNSTIPPELNRDLVDRLVIRPLNDALESDGGDLSFGVAKMSVENYVGARL